MIRDIDRRAVTVAARLNLQGYAEVRRVHLHHDRPPTLTLVICGVEIDLNLPEARALRDALADGTARLEKAQGNLIAREKQTELAPAEKGLPL